MFPNMCQVATVSGMFALSSIWVFCTGSQDRERSESFVSEITRAERVFENEVTRVQLLYLMEQLMPAKRAIRALARRRPLCVLGQAVYVRTGSTWVRTCSVWVRTGSVWVRTGSV